MKFCRSFSNVLITFAIDDVPVLVIFCLRNSNPALTIKMFALANSTPKTGTVFGGEVGKKSIGHFRC
jgi:hypothetical protein